MTDTAADDAKLLPDAVTKVFQHFCGCGDPAAAWTWVRDYLANCDRDSGGTGWYDAKTGPDWLAMYLMDSCGLTEHGGGIRSAWLTAAGREVLAFLQEHGPDWQDKHDWVDADGTYYMKPG